MDRRDFLKAAAGVLVSYGFGGRLLAGPAAPKVTPRPSGSWAAFGKTEIGPLPKAVLQIDPKGGDLSRLWDVTFYNSNFLHPPVRLWLQRQHGSAGSRPADVLPRERGGVPGVLAWEGGPVDTRVGPLWHMTLPGEAYCCRWVAPLDGSGDIIFSSPGLAVVAMCESPMNVDVMAVGGTY